MQELELQERFDYNRFNNVSIRCRYLQAAITSYSLERSWTRGVGGPDRPLQ